MPVRDSKSAEVHPSWGFDPPSRHQPKASFSAAILISAAKGVFTVLLCWSVVSVVCVLCVEGLMGKELRGCEVVVLGLQGWMLFTMLYQCSAGRSFPCLSDCTVTTSIS